MYYIFGTYGYRSTPYETEQEAVLALAERCSKARREGINWHINTKAPNPYITNQNRRTIFAVARGNE